MVAPSIGDFIDRDSLQEEMVITWQKSVLQSNRWVGIAERVDSYSLCWTGENEEVL